MYDVNKLQERLDEIAEQGRQNSSSLELISTKLFGSEEDHFAAGRLPVLERGFESLSGRIDRMERSGERLKGQRTVLKTVLMAAGKTLLAGLSALAGAIFGAHFHK